MEKQKTKEVAESTPTVHQIRAFIRGQIIALERDKEHAEKAVNLLDYHIAECQIKVLTRTLEHTQKANN